MASKQERIEETRLGRYAAYIIRNSQRWESVKSKYDIDIRTSEIALVTGLTASPLWMNNISVESTSDAAGSIALGPDGPLRIKVAVKRKHERRSSFYLNIGPYKRRLETSKTLRDGLHKAFRDSAQTGVRQSATDDDKMAMFDITLAEPVVEEYDQCLFVERMKVWSKEVGKEWVNRLFRRRQRPAGDLESMEYIHEIYRLLKCIQVIHFAFAVDPHLQMRNTVNLLANLGFQTK
jgi:hypothetical protein